MSSMETDGAPLLNEYKLEFFWKRFPQTLFGGLKLRVGSGTPCYVYLNQILIFLLPFLLGGVFTLLAELDAITADLGCYVYGASMFLAVLCLQLFSWYVRKNSSYVGKLDQNVFSEEDEVEFESCCGYETVDFILPKKKFLVSIVIHALISGPLCGLMYLFLLPTNLEALFASAAATVMLFMFGWLSVCIAQYSLTVSPPPEVAIFRTQDILDTHSLMRPFYLAVFGVVGILSSVYPEVLVADKILHIILPFLPILWVLGILPPLDALFSWSGEQALVLLLGGSSMATDLRLLVMFLSSSIIFIVVYFIPSISASVIVASAMGFILSWDWSAITSWIWKKCTSSTGTKSTELMWIPLVTHGVTLVLAVAASCASNILSTCSVAGDSSCNLVVDVIGYILIGLLVFVKISGDLQGVYVFFGLIRNYFYPNNVHSVGKFKDKKKHLRRLAAIRHVVITYVSPLVMVSLLGFTSLGSSDNLSGLAYFIYILARVRAFRWVWQNTMRSLTEVVIVLVIKWATLDSIWWNSLHLEVQLLIVGALWNRAVEFAWKMLFAFTLIVTSWTEKKQRHKLTIPLLTVSVILCPVAVGIIALCAAISAPLLPLFCLPFFLIGYPRPLRSWPDAAGTGASYCPDSALYAQLSPEIQQAVASVISSGSLDEPCPGDHYLIRYQDRMVWVHVLERGFNFISVVMRGLEIQETSCHTVEATRIDDIIDASLSKETSTPVYLNSYFVNTVRLCDSVVLQTYSDARNVLTGIIEQPENLKRNSENFIKTLIWVLLHHCKHRKTTENATQGPDEMSQTKRHEVLGVSTVDCMSPLVVTNKHSLDMKKTKSVASLSESLWSKEDFEDSFELGESFSKKPKTKRQSSRTSVELVSMNKRDPKTVLNIEDEYGYAGLPSSEMKTYSSSKDSGLGSTLKRVPSLPGMLDEEDSDDSDDEIFRNLKKKQMQTPVPVTVIPDTTLSSPMSEHARLLELPGKWRSNLPVEPQQLEKLKSSFPNVWFKHVLGLLDFGSNQSTILQSLTTDSVLMSSYRDLVLACYCIVDMMGLTGQSVVSAGPHHIYKVFNGDIPWSIYMDWLVKDEELKGLVLKAYRYAFKLTYDEAVLGEADTEEELAEYLEEYDKDWYMGSEQERGWTTAVGSGTPTLFSLGYDKEKGAYTSHILTKQEVLAPICRLNKEAVRGQWASLALELLYMTNDDEERYSIQAHPTLLRNLTIQAADNPLGYAIYSSGAVSIPFTLP